MTCRERLPVDSTIHPSLLPFENRSPGILAGRRAAHLLASLHWGWPCDQDLSTEVEATGTSSGSHALKRKGLAPHSLSSPS